MNQKDKDLTRSIIREDKDRKVDYKREFDTKVNTMRYAIRSVGGGDTTNVRREKDTVEYKRK